VVDAARGGRWDGHLFASAADYLGCAREGLDHVDSLRVESGTVYAIDAYETVSRAVPDPGPEDVQRMRDLIDRMRSACARLAQGQAIPPQEIEDLASFFTSLSRYTTEERGWVLQQSSAAPSFAAAGNGH